MTFEQEYPTAAVEQRILNKICDDADFCKRLSDWADIIRKTFYDGGLKKSFLPSPSSYRQSIQYLWDKAKAIEVCVNRFDDETKQAFLELYDKVDVDFTMPGEETELYVVDSTQNFDTI